MENPHFPARSDILTIRGVSELLYEAEKRLLLQILEDEVAWLTGEPYSRQAGRGARR